MDIHLGNPLPPQVDKGVKDLFGSEGEGTTQVRSLEEEEKHIDLRQKKSEVEVINIFRVWMTWMCGAASIKLMVASLPSGDLF